jgi:ABC-type multidrug transport system permease subunit
MPISDHPIAVISPLTYFIDIVNVSLGLESAFGQYGILIDFGVLIVSGFLFLFLAFILHKKTLQKRF